MKKTPIQINWKGLNNNWLTKSLFLEYKYIPTVTDNTMYCLSDNDRDSYPSLRRLYLECEDPTEYTFAKQHLGGWTHWKYLCDEAFFQPIVESWREELSVLLKSRALAAIKSEAMTNDSKKAYDAHKYLLEEGWIKDTRRAKAGRRSKEIISAEADKILSKTNNETITVLDDYKRILKDG